MKAYCIVAMVLMLPFPAIAADLVGRASVIDGDTIEVQGVRIRFDGVDAPESRQVCRDAVGTPYRCGRMAAEALNVFLAQSRPITCTKVGKSWDRIVATCRRADGQDVNRWLVENGHAIDWPKYSKGRYAGEQNRAKAGRRGLWCGTFEWPCTVRGASCK